MCAENGNKGILLIGYGEGQRIHYVGELLQPLGMTMEKGEVKELMKAVGNRYQKLKEECNNLDNLWNNKAFQVGDKTFAEQILHIVILFLPIGLCYLRIISHSASEILSG